MRSPPTRRGQAELVVYVFRIILIGILVFLLNVQLGLFLSTEIPSEPLEAALITERLLNGPSGLALREPGTGRLLPGTLDLARFDSKDVTAAYFEGYGEGNLWGGLLSLYTSERDLAAGRPFRTAELGEDGLAVSLLPLAKAGARGRGGGNYYASTHPVLFVPQPGAEQEIGWLVVELVRRT